MDPFLEINPRWEVFHGWFIRELARQNQSRSRELGCWIGVERTVYQQEPYKQEYLVVREVNQFQRVLAVVEMLSFANKEGTYVPKYREKRSKFLSSLAHFMEIDLLRAGDNPSRAVFPELPRTPYFIFVARKTGLGRNEEGYPLRLQDPLPTIGLPLGPPRPDLPLDLAAAFRSAYDLSAHPGWIRYAEERIPPPPLSAEDESWFKEIVHRA
jgi:hypothetical protein